MRSVLEQLKRVPRNARLGIGAAIVVIVAIVLIAGGGDDSTGSGSKYPMAKPTKNDPSNVGEVRTKLPDVPTLASQRKKKKASGCGEKATETCAPRLPAGGSLNNDGLMWSIESVGTRKRVGNPAVTATGTYLAVKVKVSSDKDGAVTLTDQATALKMGKSNFATDGEATLAVVGTNQPDFLYSDLSKGKSKTGTLLFDIPSDRLGQPAQLRVNKAGDDTPGDQYGFIALPSTG